MPTHIKNVGKALEGTEVRPPNGKERAKAATSPVILGLAVHAQLNLVISTNRGSVRTVTVVRFFMKIPRPYPPPVRASVGAHVRGVEDLPKPGRNPPPLTVRNRTMVRVNKRPALPHLV
jgi:hypothetical protein